MVDLKVNGSKLLDIKTGQSEKGPYAVGVIKDDNEKSYRKIDVWATNPDKVDPSQSYKVGEVKEVKFYAKKATKQNGEEYWKEICAVNAEFVLDGFTKMSPEEEELPF